METIDLKPIRERKLSFEKLASLSDRERADIEQLKIVLPEISYDLNDADLSEEIDLGHVVARFKKVIYESDFSYGR